MIEMLGRFDHIQAGAFLARRTLPIKNSTIRPGSLYRATHGVKAYVPGQISYPALDLGDHIYGLVAPSPMYAVPSMFLTWMEKLRRDLGRLQDGWCGEGSLSPSPQVLADFDHLTAALPLGAGLPEAEVDESTGFVTLRWAPPNQLAGVSFVLRGDGNALCVTTRYDPPQATSKSFALHSEEGAIARLIETDPLVYGAVFSA